MLSLKFHRPVIVIGMHRSGTSLVAKLLHESGIFMGAHRDHNEESFPFLNVNQKVMAEAGHSWIDPGHFTEYDACPETAISMYVNHFQLNPDDFVLAGRPRARMVMWLHNKRWGFKDPRSTYTLKMWLKLFPKAKVIHVVRHPRSVVASLQRRNEIDGEVQDERLFDANFGLQLWKDYVETAIEQGKDLPRARFLTLKYEDILKGGVTLTDLGRFVGTDLVKVFSSHIHPDRGMEAPDLDLSSVRELLTHFKYEE